MPNSQLRSNKSTTGRAQPPFALTATRTALRVLSRVTPDGAALAAEHLFLLPKRRPRPSFERDLLASAERGVVQTKWGALATWEWWPEGAEWPWSEQARAPKVLLVHGWEGRGAQLGALVGPLAARGFRVSTFDAPAHGDSPGLESSFFHFADAIAAVVEAQGPFDAIVTHSMGGASMLWASRHRPLASRVAMIAPPVDLRDFTRGAARILDLSDGVRERLNDRIGGRFGVDLGDVRAEPIAATMKASLLIVHDEGDREVPVACGEAIANARPDGRFIRTKGLGHHRILRDPEVVQAIVEFVAAR